jgi:hypothetical protein
MVACKGVRLPASHLQPKIAPHEARCDNVLTRYLVNMGLFGTLEASRLRTFHGKGCAVFQFQEVPFPQIAQRTPFLFGDPQNEHAGLCFSKPPIWSGPSEDAFLGIGSFLQNPSRILSWKLDLTRTNYTATLFVQLFLWVGDHEWQLNTKVSRNSVC